MAVVTEVLSVGSEDGQTISQARLRMTDDEVPENPSITIVIRRNPGHATVEDSLDPHGIIAYSYFPAIEQAMDEILGGQVQPTLAQFGLSSLALSRRYS